jgi:hypothetical protein
MKLAASLQRRLREEPAEADIEAADLLRGGGGAFAQADDGGADVGRELDGSEIEQARAVGAQGFGRDAHQGDVDAVGGGAGHQSENEAGPAVRFAHEICFFSSARRLSASKGRN